MKVFDIQNDMAQAPSTSLVLFEPLDPLVYSELGTDEASGNFYAASLDYEVRSYLGSAQGGVRHARVSIGQLISTYIYRCFEEMYDDRRAVTPEELLNAFEQHAEYTTIGGKR